MTQRVRVSPSVFRVFSSVILVTFTYMTVLPVSLSFAQETFVLPQPGVRIGLSPEFTPAHLNGITIHQDNALRFDFLVHRGDQPLADNEKKEEYSKLIKYFLASLTIPDMNQWVNLSPYEKDRIIEGNFGKTEMGRDLLGQDYLLKQITASLIYPEEGLGRKFWDKIYERAFKEYGTTEVPVNTFNKVWIVPDKAVVYESGNTAYILKSHLKVMLEEDYLSKAKHENTKASSVSSQVVREIILPALEKEVNEGKNFAQLRQIYSAMILATWYKKSLKTSLLGQIYADKAKVKGVDQDPKANQEIYQQYLQAFKKGVYNYIREDVDRYTHQPVPRKYFSGGFGRDRATTGGAPEVEIFTLKDVPSMRNFRAEVDEAALAMQNGGIDRASVVLNLGQKVVEKINQFRRPILIAAGVVLFSLMASNSFAGTYIVQKDDTLSKLAKQNHTTVSRIVSLNSKIKHPNKIRVGWQLEMPSGDVEQVAEQTLAEAVVGVPQGAEKESDREIVQESSPKVSLTEAIKNANVGGTFHLGVYQKNIQRLNELNRKLAELIKRRQGISRWSLNLDGDLMEAGMNTKWGAVTGAFFGRGLPGDQMPNTMTSGVVGSLNRDGIIKKPNSPYTIVFGSKLAGARIHMESPYFYEPDLADNRILGVASGHGGIFRDWQMGSMTGVSAGAVSTNYIVLPTREREGNIFPLLALTHHFNDRRDSIVFSYDGQLNSQGGFIRYQNFSENFGVSVNHDLAEGSLAGGFKWRFSPISNGWRATAGVQKGRINLSGDAGVLTSKNPFVSNEKMGHVALEFSANATTTLGVNFGVENRSNMYDPQGAVGGPRVKIQVKKSIGDAKVNVGLRTPQQTPSLDTVKENKVPLAAKQDFFRALSEAKDMGDFRKRLGEGVKSEVDLINIAQMVSGFLNNNNYGGSGENASEEDILKAMQEGYRTNTKVPLIKCPKSQEFTAQNIILPIAEESGIQVQVVGASVRISEGPHGATMVLFPNSKINKGWWSIDAGRARNTGTTDPLTAGDGYQQYEKVVLLGGHQILNPKGEVIGETVSPAEATTRKALLDPWANPENVIRVPDFLADKMKKGEERSIEARSIDMEIARLQKEKEALSIEIFRGLEPNVNNLETAKFTAFATSPRSVLGKLEDLKAMSVRQIGRRVGELKLQDIPGLNMIIRDDAIRGDAEGQLVFSALMDVDENGRMTEFVRSHITRIDSYGKRGFYLTYALVSPDSNEYKLVGETFILGPNGKLITKEAPPKKIAQLDLNQLPKAKLQEVRDAYRKAWKGKSNKPTLEQFYLGNEVRNDAVPPVGGIDLNSANLDLQIKRDGRGVPLPVQFQDMEKLRNIQGFMPVIINIVPLTTLPLLSELKQKFQPYQAIAKAP